MDADTRLKALARLAQSQTDAAGTALQSEFDSVAAILREQGDYELLTQSLAALDVFGYRFSARAVEVLESFVRTIESRGLIYSDKERAFVRDITAYKNAQTLLAQAIEVLTGLRYLETPSVLRLLLPLARHESEKVSKKAFEALEALAGYDLDVFFGNDRQGGIGAAPQQVVVEALEGLTDAELAANFKASRALLDALLSPTMEGSTWSYKAVTLSRGATPPAPAISEIRWRSIQLLKRLYRVAETVAERLSVVNALHGATRTHDRNVANGETSAMIMRDATEVLAFYEQLVAAEDLQIVQKIESHGYWIYYHAHRSEIKEAAQKLEKAISRNQDYQIYRVLVGFEGVFGDWAKLTTSDRDFSATDEYRRASASEYVASINESNFSHWRKRILAYAKTESEDLATFPVFYSFLEAFAKAHPTLALNLLRNDSEAIARFLIPLLRGLWSGPERPAVRAMIENWISEAEATQGRHLFASTKLFLSVEELDIELLKRLLAKAADLKDFSTVRQIISVAVTNYREDDDVVIDQLFMPALAILSRESDAGWIFDAWFRKELRIVLSKLNEKSIELVLQNLKALQTIDYHADEVLSVIAERAPEAVIAFFCDRIDWDRETRSAQMPKYEAVPFEFHKLQEPLSRAPLAAVRRVRELYEKDSALFQFRGARLLKNIFPKFSSSFEEALLALVKEGGEQNHRFVLAILGNYKGELFIHQLCKEIVKALPAGSRLRNQVAIALESTGVVSGEFGIADAYERKRQEILEWLTDPDERVRDFAKSYIEDLEQMRDAERKRAEEDLALRKYRFGEPQS